MARKSKNGRCITYKFKSPEHMDLFDKGKISFEEATEKKVPDPMLEFVTHYQLKKASEKHPNYIYPNMLHKDATKFLIVVKETGEAKYKPYLYTEKAFSIYDDKYLELYITNVTV